jgi:hypothetical protein
MDTLLGNRNCCVDRCECAAAACLADQALCLSHFIRDCYDQLDRIDPRAQKKAAVEGELRGMRNALEECSEQALRICLSGRPLNNLERGRLLDILLRAGELYVLLRLPGCWRTTAERSVWQAGPLRRSHMDERTTFARTLR